MMADTGKRRSVRTTGTPRGAFAPCPQSVTAGVRFVLLLAAGALAGCDVEGGSGLDQVVFTASESETRTFQCVFSGLEVQAEFADGAVEDATQRAEWRSSDPDVVRVSNGEDRNPSGETLRKGILQPVGQPGETATITAEFGEQSASFELAVEETKLSLDPERLRLARGTRVALRPTLALGEGDARSTVEPGGIIDFEVSAVAAPGLEDPDGEENLLVISPERIATAVDNALPLGSIARREITASTGMLDADGSELCAAGTVRVPLTIVNETLEGLDLALQEEEVPERTSQSVSVTGVFTNGYQQELTEHAILESEDPSIAEFGPAGDNVLTSGSGADGESVTVWASYDPAGRQRMSEAAQLSVIPASLESLVVGRVDSDGEVRQEDFSALTGTALRYSAVGIFRDDDNVARVYNLTRDVSWRLQDPETGSAPDASIAEIFNEPGRHGAVFIGDDASAEVTVIAERAADAMSAETTLRFDGTLDSLEMGEGSKPSEGEEPEPKPPEDIGVSQVFSLSAVGQLTDESSQNLTSNVQWSSSNPEVAIVNNSPFGPGRLIGVSEGSTLIRGRFGDAEITFVVTVQQEPVEPPEPPEPPPEPEVVDLMLSAEEDDTRLFQCVFAGLEVDAVFSDGSMEDQTLFASWSSSDPDAVRVSNGADTTPSGSELRKGILQPVGEPGDSAVITVEHEGISVDFEATVEAAELELSPPRLRIARGTEVPLRPTITLGSGDDQSIANASNILSQEIRGPDGDIVSAEDQLLRITDEQVAVALDNSRPQGSRVTLALTSSTDMFAADGESRCASGTVQLPMIIRNERLETIEVTFSASPELPEDASQQVSATGHFSGDFSQDLSELASFEVADTSVASLGSRGGRVVTTLPGSAGETTAIQATFEQQVTAMPPRTGEAVLEVIPATLDTLLVLPEDASTLAGTLLPFTAAGIFLDEDDNQRAYNLTRDVVWALEEAGTGATPDEEVVSISNEAGTQGLLSSAPDGNPAPLTITALRDDGTTATTGLAFDAVPSALDIDGQDVLGIGQVIALAATAEMAEDVTQNVNPHARWSSSDPEVALALNSPFAPGRIIGRSEGTAVIEARFEGLVASFPVTVQTEPPPEPAPDDPEPDNCTLPNPLPLPPLLPPDTCLIP